MAFLEQQLSPRITQGAQGGPTVPGRTKIYSPSGRLKQNFLASLPVHRYDVSHGLRSIDDAKELLDLWYVVMFTPYEGFRFKDWRDYRLTPTNSRLTLIEGNVYQINRVHTFAGIEFLRPIYKPTAAVVVYDAGSNVLGSETDITTGRVTIDSGTPAGCLGEFDVPVTFTDDEWVGTLQTLNFVDMGAIKLEEIRL